MGAALTAAGRPTAVRPGVLLRLVVVLLVAVGGAWLIWRDRQDIGAAIDQVSIGRFVAAGLLGVAGTITIERVWFSLLAGLGAGPGRRDAWGMFFVSQLGKYLPGSVWPVVAQMQFGARWGIARRLMLAANILLLAVVTSTGILVGGLLLPWSSTGGLQRYWWLLPLLLPLALTLHPRTVPALLDFLLRRVGREPLGAAVSSAGLSRALLWSAACWLVFGLHLTVLAGAFTDVDVKLLAVGTGVMGLAWAAGIVFIPAPAGAGVREGVLVLTYAPVVGAAEALTIALASRVLLLLADVALAGVGALAGRGASAADEQ